MSSDIALPQHHKCDRFMRWNNELKETIYGSIAFQPKLNVIALSHQPQ
ncbi:hypothetical protein [Nostoc sp.]